MNNPKISIISICFNNEKDIRPTIKSVINQTYPNIEYIIVDGKSTDGTLKIIKEFNDRISKWISEPDQGLYDAINKGIKMATGDIVGLIHAGDKLYDNRVIEKIADHFEKNDVDVSYGHSKLVNEKGIPVRINRSPNFSKKLIRQGWMPSHQSIYIRRSVFEKHGYYNLALHPSSDYEFFLRYFYFNNLRVKRLDEYILKFAMGGRSTKNYLNNLKAQKQHKECWKVNGENPPLFLIPFKLMRKPKQFVLALINKFF